MASDPILHPILLTPARRRSAEAIYGISAISLIRFTAVLGPIVRDPALHPSTGVRAGVERANDLLVRRPIAGKNHADR